MSANNVAVFLFTHFTHTQNLQAFCSSFCLKNVGYNFSDSRKLKR